MYQLPGSNAVATAGLVKAKMEELKKRRFREGLDYAIVYDTTPFINESIHEVLKALLDAIVLVALVVLLFLQNWRATLIPLMAVPVSLVGTFAVMALLGFSLNNISLFGLVLAIGIVVDDAIVVVENVERWIEHGLAPREAAYKSMDEVTVAVIAIAFGLSAVFIPTAFISRHHRAVLPAVRPDHRHGDADFGFQLADAQPRAGRHPAASRTERKGPADAASGRRAGLVLPRLQRRVRARPPRSTSGWCGLCVRGAAVALLVYVGLLGLTYFGFTHVPTGFVPQQDKGYLIVNAQLPDAASLERTQAVMRQMEQIARRCPASGTR